MKHPIKGLIFDKDGTLFDFRASWDAWGAALIDKLGKTETERDQLSTALRFDRAQGGFRPDSVVIAGTPGDVIEAITRIRPTDDRQMLMDVIVNSSAEAPQAEATPLAPLLDRLVKAGLCLGVATNDAEAPARAHLRQAGVEDRFDFIAGSDSGFGAKPEPGMLIGFLKATGLSAKEVAMIGDSRHDLKAGRAAGMTTIGVLTGTATASILSPMADATLTSIAALPEWLGLTPKG